MLFIPDYNSSDWKTWYWSHVFKEVYSATSEGSATGKGASECGKVSLRLPPQPWGHRWRHIFCFQIDWVAYFNYSMPVKVLEDEYVVCMAMEYLHKLGPLLVSADKKVLTNYLLWRLILGLVPEMTDKYQRQRSEYLQVLQVRDGQWKGGVACSILISLSFITWLQGVSRDKVRWQKCVEYVNERMGMAVGKLFVRDYFKKESKDTVSVMIYGWPYCPKHATRSQL